MTIAVTPVMISPTDRPNDSQRSLSGLVTPSKRSGATGASLRVKLKYASRVRWAMAHVPASMTN